MGIPLLLLHGALGSSSQLYPLQQILSIATPVELMEFEGHGNSRSTAKFSINLFTQNCIDYLLQHNIEKVHIFGYSMGGYVALNLAKKRPDLVEKIITLGTKFDWSPEFAHNEVRKLDSSKIELKVPLFAERLRQLHGSENWKNVVSKTAEMMEELGRKPELSIDDFRNIQNPTLVCLGQFDTMTTTAESVKISRFLPQGEFREIETLNHPIESVPPQVIVSIIKEYLLK